MSTKMRVRVLLYDIETSPNLGYVWGKWQQDVVKFESEWILLSFAWKWLGESKTHVLTLPDFDLYETDPTDDRELVTKLWELFNEADIVIAHNGDRFDQKKSNARFLAHGMTPPSPYRTVDTLKVAKRNFSFNSMRLGDLGKMLGLGVKAETGGFETWLGCMRGDKRAWNKMARYNKQDVVLLEKIYLALRPWAQTHPGMNLLNGDMEACPKCGGGPMIRQGIRHTQTGTYQRFQCTSCGGWSRSRLAEKSNHKVAYVN